jgi:hypothetical protein
MPIQHYQYNAQSGNILIYILGAIFLLGVLIMTMKSSNTPGSNIDEETLMLRVSEIQDYGSELERAVSYVLRNGHSEVDIRFAHPNAPSAYGDIADDPTRQVFHRDGGGALYRDIPNGIQVTPTPWVFNSKNQVTNIGTTCGNPSCADILFIIPNVSSNFCNAVNTKNNVGDGTAPQDDGNVDITSSFDGTFNVINVIRDLAPNYLDGKSEACFEGFTDPPAGTYHYYRVLLPR